MGPAILLLLAVRDSCETSSDFPLRSHSTDSDNRMSNLDIIFQWAGFHHKTFWIAAKSVCNSAPCQLPNEEAVDRGGEVELVRYEECQPQDQDLSQRHPCKRFPPIDRRSSDKVVTYGNRRYGRCKQREIADRQLIPRCWFRPGKNRLRQKQKKCQQECCIQSQHVRRQPFPIGMVGAYGKQLAS